MACAEGLENAIRCAPYGSDEVAIPFHLLNMRSEVVKELRDGQNQVREAAAARQPPQDPRHDPG
jgi:hypothetical protein